MLNIFNFFQISLLGKDTVSIQDFKRKTTGSYGFQTFTSVELFNVMQDPPLSTILQNHVYSITYKVNRNSGEHSIQFGSVVLGA